MQKPSAASRWPAVPGLVLEIAGGGFHFGQDAGIGKRRYCGHDLRHVVQVGG